MQGNMDVPVATMAGLALHASGQAPKLADEWMNKACTEAGTLLLPSVTQYDMGVEDELELYDVSICEAGAAPCVVVNPLAAGPGGR